jgi:beta-lactamase regulating signal transducer with metallopeptidase domain
MIVDPMIFDAMISGRMISDAMNSAVAFRIVISLGECIVIATGILFMARLMTMLLRRNAAMRHLIWLIAFFSLLITPALVAFIPSQFVLHVPSAVAKSSEDLRANDASIVGDLAADNSKSNQVQGSGRSLPIAATLLGIWLSGIGVMAFMGSVAAYRIRRFRRNSVEHAFNSLDVTELSTRIGLQRRWKLRVSSMPEPRAAMTWGVLRPVILLPKESVLWNSDRLEAVLLHELAHVRRNDSLSQWLAFAVCAMYWFHPAVWRFVRAMRAEAELAADDAVLMSGVKPSAYAALLLRFAAELAHRRAPLAYASVSFMRQSRITARIESILNHDQRERKVTSLQAGKAIGFGLGAVLLLAALRPSVSLASASSVRNNISVSGLVSVGPEPPLPPTVLETNQAKSPPAVPAKASSSKRCHKKDAALKKLKTASAG